MEKLNFIGYQLNDVLKIPYRFGQWNAAVQYPYAVGEITEEPISTEDGHESSTFLLTVFCRGQEALLELSRIKEKVKKHFPAVYGLRGSTEKGAIDVFYDGAMFVSTGKDNLKTMQINLKIEEWKGAV